MDMFLAFDYIEIVNVNKCFWWRVQLEGESKEKWVHYAFGSLLTEVITALTKQRQKQLFLFNGTKATGCLDSCSQHSHRICVSRVCQFGLSPFSLWAISCVSIAIQPLSWSKREPCCYPDTTTLKTQGELRACQTTIRTDKDGNILPRIILQTHLHQVENIRIGFCLWKGIFGSICSISLQK